MSNIQTQNELRIGDKIRMEDAPQSNGALVRYYSTVVRIDGERALLRIPSGVQALPFPPFGKGVKGVWFAVDKCLGARKR